MTMPIKVIFIENPPVGCTPYLVSIEGVPPFDPNIDESELTFGQRIGARTLAAMQNVCNIVREHGPVRLAKTVEVA